eukprot:1548014-Rhodomonas_salina.1
MPYTPKARTRNCIFSAICTGNATQTSAKSNASSRIPGTKRAKQKAGSGVCLTRNPKTQTLNAVTATVRLALPASLAVTRRNVLPFAVQRQPFTAISDHSGLSVEIGGAVQSPKSCDSSRPVGVPVGTARLGHTGCGDLTGVGRVVGSYLSSQ